MSPTVGSVPTVSAILGDINDDGKVNCTALEIVKASVGKSLGSLVVPPGLT